MRSCPAPPPTSIPAWCQHPLSGYIYLHIGISLPKPRIRERWLIFIRQDPHLPACLVTSYPSQWDYPVSTLQRRQNGSQAKRMFRASSRLYSGFLWCAQSEVGMQEFLLRGRRGWWSPGGAEALNRARASGRSIWHQPFFLSSRN